MNLRIYMMNIHYFLQNVYIYIHMFRHVIVLRDKTKSSALSGSPLLSSTVSLELSQDTLRKQ